MMNCIYEKFVFCVLLALGDELGWDSLHEFADQWFDYSERRMAVAIGELPNGQATSSSTHDHFPGTPEDGITVNATVSIDPEAAIIEVDLRDNLDSLPCGLNVSEACTRTSCLIGVFNSIDHTVPKNAGSFRRVKLRLKEGGVVGIPLHPTSCSVATTNLSDRIAAAVQTAFASIADGIGMAEVGAVIPPSVAVISGVDPRTGEAFVNQLFLGATGGAGTPSADCWTTYTHVGNGGLCYIDSIELDEIYQPIHVNSRYLMQDTEGAGRYRGAPSLYVEYGPVDCSIEIGYVSDGVDNTAKGVRGGGNGGGAEQFRRLASGELETLDPCALITLLDGETVVSISCGGGGYGPAREREPEKVLHDVREGWISRERARDVYQVALTADDEIDTEATRTLRSA